MIKTVHITHVILALCATTTLAVPQHADLNARSGIMRRSAVGSLYGINRRSALASPSAYAQGDEDPTVDKGDSHKPKKPKKGKEGSSSGGECPSWTYTHFPDGRCAEKADTPVRSNKPLPCNTYPEKPKGVTDGFTFIDKDVWELHVFTSTDCTASSEDDEWYVPREGSVPGMCYRDGKSPQVTHSFKIILKEGADCTPGQ
ncbi:hypothetical protein Tdes44962_MAKER09153 [Teratosphaeria destructans]|uniref:Uncharacterized protein n=1 Tax=Teratosphaeria destructans TaxID=418781 RepID=A0A9W7SU46_9PEZI|nr:hypothetical protein Tdes44962_MAKER09153 [Teratosphaeria destructans]